MTGASHSNSCKGWARQCREFKKELGVRSAAGSLFKAGAVADSFAQFVEFAFQPPSQWAEPENACVNSRQQLQIEISLANMRALMGQNNAQFLFVPFAMLGR